MSARAAKLIRLAAGEKKSGNPLRTSEIVGFFWEAPVTEESFTFYGESLTEGATVRIIQTSRVKNITAGGHTTDGLEFFQFETETGSTYRVELLPEVEA